MADAETGTHPTCAAPFIAGDWRKSTFLDDPHVDNLMSAVLQLGSELWTLKRRTLVLESFLDDKQLVERARVDAYVPTPTERVRWDRERDDFIERVFSVLTRDTAKVGGPFELEK